tara:strand:- start:765 stop:1328 length:564 start_codon:yes stop_codon:yes gene_type:complete
MNQLKTIKVQGGKEYAEVHTRVNYFRSSEEFKGWGVNCDIVEKTEKSILMKATITNPDGLVVATGHAFEEKDGSRINQRNHVENCETSAVGRALAFLGIGSDGGIASYEEVTNAIINEEKDKAKEVVSSSPQEYYLELNNEQDWHRVLKYIEKNKSKMSLEKMIKTFERKYNVSKVKSEIKKAYEGK